MTDQPSPGQHRYMVRQAAYIQRLRKQLLKDLGPTMQLSLRELRELVLQLDAQGLFRQMQWQQIEELSAVPLERVSRALQAVLREAVPVAEATAAASAAAYVSAAPPGAVNVPIDDILERVMFDRSRYSLGKSFTPEKADLISRYARKLQGDYAKTVRAGLLADEPTEAIANKVARVRVIRGREEAIRRAATFANKLQHRVSSSIDGALTQTSHFGEKRAWKGLTKKQFIWVMDPALEGTHCRICWGLSAKEPQDKPSDFWKVPGWHPNCKCKILPIITPTDT